MALLLTEVADVQLQLTAQYCWYSSFQDRLSQAALIIRHHGMERMPPRRTLPANSRCVNTNPNSDLAQFLCVPNCTCSSNPLTIFELFCSQTENKLPSITKPLFGQVICRMNDWSAQDSHMWDGRRRQMTAQTTSPHRQPP